MAKDKVFGDKRDRISPFEFDQKVANVFDDMVSRSVPFYKEVHQLILDIVDRVYTGEGNIYDLGCSTASTICLINEKLTKKNISANFVGVDNSGPMLEKAKQKAAQNKVKSVQFIQSNIQEIDFENAEVVILNYTLQFLPVADREKILTKIYQSLKKGGVLILSEKIKSPVSTIEELTTDLYYDFKRRNGYSELEISQKREALENVLIPLTPKEQMNMLKNSGFNKTEMIFRWYNFASYIGVK